MASMFSGSFLYRGGSVASCGGTMDALIVAVSFGVPLGVAFLIACWLVFGRKK